MKKFIITIDTEGDNLWNWKEGSIITTENAKYLLRFQNLANEYGFKPTWLTNYEMINDVGFAEFICNVVHSDFGEMGMHLHAWSTPPYYKLDYYSDGAPYLIEYPDDIMEEKISTMTNALKEIVGIQPVSHRAGRWALNKKYLQLLVKYGYKYDCSVTPHIDWSNHCGQSRGSGGSNYSLCKEEPFFIEGLLEIPVTIRLTHSLIKPYNNSLANLSRAVYHAIKGQQLWLRPNGYNIHEMCWLVKEIAKSDSEYIMFMLHSSELMPGGSPTFRSKEQIEKLYIDLNTLFKELSQYYEGMTVSEFGDLLLSSKHSSL